MQVYSTELVTTLGGACSRLLDGLAAHLSAPRPYVGGASSDTSLPARVIFALLQNPLNADSSGIGTSQQTPVVFASSALHLAHVSAHYAPVLASGTQCFCCASRGQQLFIKRLLNIFGMLSLSFAPLGL